MTRLTTDTRLAVLVDDKLSTSDSEITAQRCPWEAGEDCKHTFGSYTAQSTSVSGHINDPDVSQALLADCSWCTGQHRMAKLIAYRHGSAHADKRSSSSRPCAAWALQDDVQGVMRY